MDFEMPKLRRDEKLALGLRALYEAAGYGLYRMGSFEEYDLYMQNKPFLMGEEIITFTAADGRLMALRPDVTLSIVKNTPPGAKRKVCYNENVFRREKNSGEYREISQMGLEYIGGRRKAAEQEVLRLATQSIEAMGGGVLDISHMAVVQALLQPIKQQAVRADAMAALRDKSPHRMRELLQRAGLKPSVGEKMVALMELAGPWQTALPAARAQLPQRGRAQKALDEIEALCVALEAPGMQTQLRLDFSIANDVNYYNGLIFQGFVHGVPGVVLSGGRYDLLLQRLEKPQGAVGFAVYLNALEMGGASAKASAPACQWLNVALPKGRLGEQVYGLFEKAGLSAGLALNEGRKLVFEDTKNRLRFFLVKPSDVAIYVERGAADIGVVGRDVLLESEADVMELLDLELGKCRMAVAGQRGSTEDLTRPLRVATKYPAVTRAYYAAKSRPVEIIKLHGSIELAPLLGLSDVIVDIVETGTTLKENDLEVITEILNISARLIVNRASFRFKEEAVATLQERLSEVV